MPVANHRLGAIDPTETIGDLTTCVEFSRNRVVVAVKGYLDIFTSRQLGTILSAVVVGGHRHLVVDLAKCDFIDSSALQMIDECSGSLRAVGGRLTLRSPSRVVRRLLGLVGASDLSFEIEESRHPSNALSLT